MELKIILSLIAIAMLIGSYYFYVKDILYGSCRPHLFTWIIWFGATLIAMFGQFSDKAGAGAWVTMASAFFCFIIIGLSFKYGEKKITRFDWVCLSTVMLAFGLWFLADQLLWSVVLVTIIDVLGYLPSVKKSLRDPHNENAEIYIVSGFRSVLAVAALSHFSVLTLLFPGVLIVTNFLFGGFLWWRQRKKI